MSPTLIAKLLHLLQLNSAHVDIRPEWKSEAREYRGRIRAQLVSQIQSSSLLKFLSPDEKKSLEDLSSIPAHPELSISITHCPRAGGFILGRREGGNFGMDLEEASRVSEKVMARLSTPDEMQVSPGPAFLWVAKEATFKSLFGCGQPKLVSSISIYGWQELDPHIWQFSARIQELKGEVVEGIVASEGHLILGLAKFLPQLWSGLAR